MKKYIENTSSCIKTEEGTENTQNNILKDEWISFKDEWKCTLVGIGELPEVLDSEMYFNLNEKYYFLNP